MMALLLGLMAQPSRSLAQEDGDEAETPVESEGEGDADRAREDDPGADETHDSGEDEAGGDDQQDDPQSDEDGTDAPTPEDADADADGGGEGEGEEDADEAAADAGAEEAPNEGEGDGAEDSVDADPPILTDEEPLPEVSPLPPSAIAVSANTTMATLHEMGAVLRPDPVVADIAARIPALAAQLGEEAGRFNLDELGLRELRERRQTWNRARDVVDDYQGTLSERLATLEEQAERLRSVRAEWIATRDSGRDLPETVLTQIDQILLEVQGTERVLLDREHAVLHEQRDVSNAQVIISGVLSQFESAEVALRRRLTHRTHGPIWASAPRKAEAFDGIDRMVTVTQRYLAAQTSQLFLQLLFFVFLTWFAFYMARYSRDAGRPVPPLSTAVFLGLSLTPWMHRNAPALVYDVMAVAMLPPLLRLSAPGPTRRLLLASLPFVVIEATRRLMHEASDSHRSMLLASAIACAVPTLWLLHLSRQPDAGPLLRGRGRALGVFTISALGFGTVANLAGYLPLAQVLTVAGSGAFYFAGLLTIMVQVVDGLLAEFVRTPLARRSRAITRHPDLCVRRLSWLAHTLALVLWTVVTLVWLQVWEPLVEWLSVRATTPYQIGAVKLSMFDIAAFCAALYASYWCSRFIGFLLDEDVLPRFELGRGVSPTVSMLTRYILLGLGFVLAVAAAGVELSQLAFLVGALGVGIGFGLQNIVGNFVAGLVLIFERPVKIGDVVEVDSLTGEVTRIGLRASTVRARDGAEVIVPNADLISNKVVNWTLSNLQRRVDVEVGVAYGTDIKQVMELLSAAAAAVPSVLHAPKPTVLFTGFGASSLDFVVRAWTAEHLEWRAVHTQIGVAVAEALEAEDIEVPFPQRVVHPAPSA